jgi:hypothetical protein
MHPHPKNSGDGIRQALNIDLKTQTINRIKPYFIYHPPPQKKRMIHQAREGGGQVERGAGK